MQNKAMTDLSSNGGEIAKFLSGANPNLAGSALIGLLTAHVAHQHLSALIGSDCVERTRSQPHAVDRRHAFVVPKPVAHCARVITD